VNGNIGLRPDDPEEPELAMVKTGGPARLDWHLLAVPWYDCLLRLNAACRAVPDEER